MPAPVSFRRFVAFFLAGVPAAVLLLMLVGLYVADRVALEADAAYAEADASQVAANVQRFVVGRSAVLWSLQSAPRGLDSASWKRRLQQGLSVAAEYVPEFGRIWVVDQRQSVLADTVVNPALESPRAGYPNTGNGASDVAEVVSIAMRDKRTAVGWAGAPTDSAMELIVASPVLWGDSIVGAAVGLIPGTSLLSEATRSASPELVKKRRSLLITSTRSGTTPPAGSVDTIAVWGGQVLFSGLLWAHASVDDPPGLGWSVSVAHVRTGWPARIALWVIGLMALSALAISSLRERDQSRRITERSQELERLSTELLHANRAKSEFLANVSHELRTPLNAIVGFVDLLRDGVYGELGPRQVGPVDRIAASATHLRQLVDQVLDLAKITAGRLEVYRDTVDLRAFVLAVVSEIESLVTERALALSVGISVTLPRLRTDPSHLRQILVNLIGNAIKYTPAGSVAIRARLVEEGSGSVNVRHARSQGIVSKSPVIRSRDGPWVAVQVIDTGIGIAAEDYERIFDEFEQVGAGPRGDSMRRGTGLGLSISRRLARLLGGDIEVESELGKGSTFTVWLPADPADVGGHDSKGGPHGEGLI